jgi:isopentenyl phosphate kinase
MRVFIKLGGSLITNKREPEKFQPEIMTRAAAEIADVLAEGRLQAVIGHGSGSFGHTAAQRHGTMHGVRTAAEWRGFAEVSRVARRLNELVMAALAEAGLPVIGFQPSASARAANGEIESMETGLIAEALDRGLVPLVHGDVAFDRVRGGTILSTETVFTYLAAHLHPARILLLGDTEGVYDAAGGIIPRITPHNIDSYAAALGGSGGTDVTGGMAAKVRGMLSLVGQHPGMEICIAGGGPGQIAAALRGDSGIGTVISASAR